jgi:hypothetical protein
VADYNIQTKEPENSALSNAKLKAFNYKEMVSTSFKKYKWRKMAFLSMSKFLVPLLKLYTLLYLFTFSPYCSLLYDRML